MFWTRFFVGSGPNPYNVQKVDLLKYVCVQNCENVINPIISKNVKLGIAY